MTVDLNSHDIPLLTLLTAFWTGRGLMHLRSALARMEGSRRQNRTRFVFPERMASSFKKPMRLRIVHAMKFFPDLRLKHTPVE